MNTRTAFTALVLISCGIGMLCPADAQLFLTTPSAEGRLIEGAQLDGSNPSTFIDLQSEFGGTNYVPQGIAVSGSHLFWVDEAQDAIFSAGVDGTGARKLIDLVPVFGGEGSDYVPRGIAASATSIFWTDWKQDAIFTARLDGSEARLLIPMAGAPFADRPTPLGIAVAGSKLFWTDDDSNNEAVYSAGVDGSNPSLVINLFAEFGGISSGLYEPLGIAASGNRIFWTDPDGGELAGGGGIFAADLDGQNATRLIDLGAVFGAGTYWPRGIAIFDSRIYWADDFTNAVYTAALDGSNPEKLFDSPNGNAWYLAAAGRAAPLPLSFTVERLTGNTLNITINRTLAGETFHLRQSTNGVTFEPLSPALDITDSTPQPIPITVDFVAHPTLLLQVYEGTSP